MTENTLRSVAIVPEKWRRVRAQWSDVTPNTAPPVVAFRQVDGGRWLVLALGWQSPSDVPTADWTPFTLRSAHVEVGRIAPEDAPFLLVVRVFAGDRDRLEFRRWLDEEHSRLQVTLPGVNWYLGYEEAGGRNSFLNVWSIDEPQLVDGGAWERIRATPWWTRVGHVSAGADRGVYRRAARGAG